MVEAAAARERRSEARWRTLAALAALTAAALALRLVCARQSIFGDELFTYEVATRSGLGDVLDGVRSPLEITPPLFFVLAWASTKLGDPTFMLRLPSLLAGVALVPLVYALGARTVGRPAALAGAALAALSPLAVFFSAEARAYMVMAFLVCASTLALLYALDARGWAWWALFAGCATGSLYAHYVALFPLAAQAAWALWAERDALRPLLIAHAAVAIAYLPWLPEIQSDRGSAFQTAIENVWPFTVEFFGRSIVTWLAGNPIVGLSHVPGTAGLVLLALAAAVAAGGVVAALRVGRPALPAPRTVLIVALAAATPVGAALYSLVAPSVFVPRTLLASLPALCLALGAFAAWLPRGWRAGFAATLLASCAVGTAHLLTDERRPGFRAAALEIDAAAAPGDAVLETLRFDVGMLEVHLERPFALYRLGCRRPITAPGQNLTGRVRCVAGPEAAERTLAAAARAARGGRLFVVGSRTGPQPVLNEALAGFRLERQSRFGGLDPLELRRYAWSGGGR